MSGTISTRWYFGDWLSEPGLRASSLAARGLWMDLLCIAGSNKGRDHGYVLLAGRVPSPADLAKVLGASVEEVERLTDELARNGVSSRDRRGAVYCRRMVRAQKNRKNGKLGGNPNVLNMNTSDGSLQPSGARGRGESSRGSGSGSDSSSDLFGRDSQAERAGRRRRPRREMPDDWTPSDAGRIYARRYGFDEQDVDRMAHACRTHHQNKGTLIADLDATWRTWVDNEVKFSRRDGAGATRGAARRAGGGNGAAAARIRLRQMMSGTEDRDDEQRRGAAGRQERGDEIGD